MSSKPYLICTQNYRPVGSFALRGDEIGQSMHALSSLIAGSIATRRISTERENFSLHNIGYPYVSTTAE